MRARRRGVSVRLTGFLLDPRHANALQRQALAHNKRGEILASEDDQRSGSGSFNARGGGSLSLGCQIMTGVVICSVRLDPVHVLCAAYSRGATRLRFLDIGGHRTGSTRGALWCLERHRMLATARDCIRRTVLELA